MTLAGASGETADEMVSVLRLSMSGDSLHEAFRQLRTETKTGGVELRIASKLWAQQGYRFVDDFLATTQSCYGA